LPLIFKALVAAAASIYTYGPLVGLVVVAAPLAASTQVSPLGLAVRASVGATVKLPPLLVVPRYTRATVALTAALLVVLVPTEEEIYPAVVTEGALTVPLPVTLNLVFVLSYAKLMLEIVVVPDLIEARSIALLVAVA
jgi:hypothetical protein